MKDLMLIIAKMMPREFILETLEEKLSTLKQANALGDAEQIKEAESGMTMACMLWSVQQGTEDMSPQELLKKSQDLEKLQALSPDKQSN